MKIGIDISQLAYPETGVAIYLRRLVENLVAVDKKNEYILFYSSLRRNFQFSIFNFKSNPKNLMIKIFKLPPTFLSLIWNKFHVFPIENLIGGVDVFISSDWTQPPTLKAKSATILYDLIVYKHPEETYQTIVETQKQRLFWVQKEADIIFCISQATKKDAEKILGIPSRKLKVIYPGI